MKYEEYIKFLKNNEETNRIIELTSTANAIAYLLVDKNICTMDEIKKIKEKYINKMLEENFKNENEETLKALKTFNDLFGNIK